MEQVKNPFEKPNEAADRRAFERLRADSELRRLLGDLLRFEIYNMHTDLAENADRLIALAVHYLAFSVDIEDFREEVIQVAANIFGYDLEFFEAVQDRMSGRVLLGKAIYYVLKVLEGQQERATVTEEARAWVISLASQQPSEFGYSCKHWAIDVLSAHVNEHCHQHGHSSLEKLSTQAVVQILYEHRQSLQPDERFRYKVDLPVEKVFYHDRRRR